MHTGPKPGGVQVAVALQVFSQAPAVVVVGGVEKECPQVVEVGALGVGEFTKHLVFHHVEQPQFLFVVAAIFEHDAMLLGALRRLHQGQTIGFRHRNGHFGRSVQSLFHGVQGHGGVQVPGCGDDHQIGQFCIARTLPRVV